MKIARFSLLILSVTFCQTAAPQENFGNFRDELIGKFIDSKPRPKFKLVSIFRFMDPNGLEWSVPPEKEVDGASIPQAFWSFIGGPFEGLYIKASVIHDHYCDEKTRTEHDTHRNFYYGMRSAGVEEWQAKFMYWAVATFGPKWKLEKRVVQNMNCVLLGGQRVCSQQPEVKTVVLTLAGVDLNDPEVLSAALSKSSSVARSLKTTEGKVLDITAIGQVSASLDNIADNAGKYRAVFMEKNFMKNAAQLGVLAKWDVSGIEHVKVWENYQLPKYSNALPLNSRSIVKIRSGEHFKLDANSSVTLQHELDSTLAQMRTVVPR